MKAIEIIKERRSVRTFSGKPLSKEDAARILAFAEEAANPYGLHIDWVLLDTKATGLRTPVYSFEKTVLFAQSIGVGTTWIAGTMDRDSFEKAVFLAADEVMPCISPLGYPSDKMSVKETIMRKGVKADRRRDFQELFFDGSFDSPLSADKSGKWKNALEAVRLAPSAVNKQPWRAVICGDTVHFYEKRSKSRNEGEWDIQKIDMGIALCHFESVCADEGLTVKFRTEDPGFAADDYTVYIASYSL